MLKLYKLPSTDEILAKLVTAGGRTIHSDIHKLTNAA